MKYFLLALLFTFPALAENPKQVIATVDGLKITRGEIEASLAEIAEMVDGGKPKLETFPKDFQKEFIDKFIDKLLLVEAGRKKNVHKDPVIVEKVKSVEDYLTQQKYLQKLVLENRSDKALRDIYKEKFQNQKDEEEIKASHILVKTESEAKEIKVKLDKGEDFEKLAKENSIEPGAKVSAGDLGYFVKDEMVPEFSTAAFKLKEGEISAPVETSFGWHIIKVTDKRTKAKLSFNEAKPALETELARRIIADEVEKLKKAKKIEYKIDLGIVEEKAKEKKVVLEPEVKEDPAKKNWKKTEEKDSTKKTPAKIEKKEEVKTDSKPAVKAVEKKEAEKK